MSVASVIVPAHDEASIIGRTLDQLLASTVADRLDIVVVCNGCRDDTAQIARSYGSPVRVIELAEGSKAKALEAGRLATGPGPRIYLDADIAVSPDALASVLDTLAAPGVEGAAPRIVLAEPADASWPLRAYAAVWRLAPYFHRSLIGSGFFALSQEAQDRIGPWPTIIADDLVALCHLAPAERRTAPEGTFTHTLPRTIRDVLAAEVRREAGRRQFEEWAASSGRSVAEEDPGGGWLRPLLRRPSLWPGIAVFVGVKLLAKRRAASSDVSTIAWASPSRTSGGEVVSP